MPRKKIAASKAAAHFDPAIGIPAFDLAREGFRQITNTHQAQIVAEVVEGCRQELQSRGLLADVERPRQTELAALVLDLHDAHREWQNNRDRLKNLRTLSRRGPGHVRKLHAAIQKIVKALSKLERDSRRVDRAIADDLGPRIRFARGVLERAALIRPGDTIEQYVARMPAWYSEAVQSGWQATDPKVFAAQSLVSYLTDSCGLPIGDAHVRTASIGNALWNWKLTIGVNDHGDPDCPGIRMWLSRARKARRRTESKKPR
jgi:hypothetical protein